MHLVYTQLFEGGFWIPKQHFEMDSSPIYAAPKDRKAHNNPPVSSNVASWEKPL